MCSRLFNLISMHKKRTSTKHFILKVWYEGNSILSYTKVIYRFTHCIKTDRQRSDKLDRLHQRIVKTNPMTRITHRLHRHSCRRVQIPRVLSKEPHLLNVNLKSNASSKSRNNKTFKPVFKVVGLNLTSVCCLIQ